MCWAQTTAGDCKHEKYTRQHHRQTIGVSTSKICFFERYFIPSNHNLLQVFSFGPLQSLGFKQLRRLV